MAETEVVQDQGLSAPGVFAPSLFSQAKSVSGELTSKPESSLPPIEFEPKDLEGVFTMPFDAAAFITKCKEIELQPKELEQLCRIWAKPMMALSQRYPSVPWVICCTATMSIIVEKVLIYYIYKHEMAKLRKQQDNSASSPEAARQEELRTARGVDPNTETVGRANA